MKNKKADIVDVAKAARVSPSTVSRSFNHPDLVKASTRRKIERAIRKLGYIRNRAAQTIHGIRSGTIGLIVPTVDQSIFAELIQSFSDAVEDTGFTILLASHGYSLEREYALTQKMLEHRVDGVALIGMDHSEDTYGLLTQQGVPTVLLWNHSKDAQFPCIGSDNTRAGRLIGDHVARLGHRRIASIFPPLTGNDRASERFDGMTAGLAEHGAGIEDRFRIEIPYSVAAAKAEVERILAEPDRPTAILCGNDVLAWGALHALARAGLPVPGAMTVTGIGDFNGSRDFEPSLTTVRIPARKIGRAGAELITAMITEQDRNKPGALFQPELIVRGTSAGPDLT